MTRDEIKIIVSQSAFPQKIEHPDGDIFTKGLTKREYFAAMAMQAILTNYSSQTIYQIEPGKKAVKYADALIAALNEIEP